MAELLIEIYSEEIPARMQLKAMEDFRKIFVEFLEKENIKFSEAEVKTFITPRRLTLFAQNLPENQITPTTKKVGPKISAPQNAVMGFAKSVDCAIEDLERVEKGGEFYYCYDQKESKIDVAKILSKNSPALLQKMAGNWAKAMDLITIENNLEKKQSWVRPIRNILAIFNGKVLNFEFANLKSNNQTFGHLLFGKRSLQVADFADYKSQLENNLVILDWFKRREIIIDGIKNITNCYPEHTEGSHGSKEISHCVWDEKFSSKLIDEITGLVEYPQVLVGKIDDEFSALPKEVLELTIKLHQKAILIQSKKSLNFIFVSNVKADENATQKIIADNEKVVRARLADAKFYIEEDLKIPFASRIELLKNITFHKKLGSLYYKIKRLDILNKFICLWVPQANLHSVDRLADFAKNDLTTKTVAELPELQGVIGGYYAKMQGESENFASAIAEQYLPTGQNSELPKTPLGITLAMADKFDNICSLFLADEKPTASKDPFALRRAALGIIRIIFDQKISLPLGIVVYRAINTFPGKVLKGFYLGKSNKEIKEIKQKLSFEIVSFFIERCKAYLKENSATRTDVVNQIFDEYLQEINHKKCDLFLLKNKAEFISQFVSDPKNIKVIELYKRSTNIVAIEERRDGKEYHGKIFSITLYNKYEKLLYKKTKVANLLVKKALKTNDYQKIFQILSELEFAIKEFFDNVEVNCKDRHDRERRLLILTKVKSLFNRVFDFSKIEIGG